jgi:hypothetical protein
MTPEQKNTPAYYFQMYQGERVVRICVWNGIRNYRNHPPDELIIGPKVMLMQVNEESIEERSSIGMLEGLPASFDTVIFWTKNHKVYRKVRDRMISMANVKIQ